MHETHDIFTAPIHFFNLKIKNLNFHFDTIFWSWIIIFVLLILSFISTRKIKKIPSILQNILETLINFFLKLSENMIGEEGYKYVPVVCTFFLFILLANCIFLIPGLIPPTRDINTTLGLAFFSFFTFNYYGIKKKGIKKWLLHFIHPVPELSKSFKGFSKIILIPLTFLFLILNIIEEIARIASLSIRLFGNIMGKHIVLGVLLALICIGLKFIFPIPLFVYFLGILVGFIQAFIFSILTLTYIALAVSEH